MRRICDVKSLDFPSVEAIKNPGEDCCPVQQMRDIIHQAREASCGVGVMCRDGLYQLETILNDIMSRNADHHDLELLKEIAEVTEICNECEMSVNIARLLLASLEANKESWEKHVHERQCDKNICIYSLYIKAETCTGCGKCAAVCPANAIKGGDKLIHIINQNLCTRCGECEKVCPDNSIGRAGQIIPRCPTEPIPVGTFTTGLGLGARRRRPKA